MSLLHEIQNAAATDDVPVATLLRKAKILAARLDHQPLRDWVEKELDGYGPEEELPDYRWFRDLDVKANFSGPFGSGLENGGVPQGCIAPEHREALFCAANRQGVAALEDLVNSGEQSFSSPWPADFVVRYADSVYEHLTMMSARRVIPRGAVVGIVDGVRNRLLSFALELEQIAPQAGEADAGGPAPKPAQVTQIFYNTIHGGQAVIAGGNITEANLALVLPAGWETLRETLASLGVPDAELENLRDAVAADGGHGALTDGWLGRLARLTGTGAVALAGGVTVELVASEVAKALGAS